MSETGSNSRRYQARKTPTSLYPATPPPLPASLDVLYLPVQQEVVQAAVDGIQEKIVTSQILYKPGLLAAARVSFQRSRWEVHSEREVIKIIPFPPHPLVADWENTLSTAWDQRHSRSTPEEVCFYLCDRNFDFSEQRMETLREDFIDHLVAREFLQIDYNPSLKIFRKPDESQESFAARCLETATEELKQEMKQLEDTLQRLQDRLKERLDREVREIGPDRLELQDSGSPSDHLKRNRTVDNQEEMDFRGSIANIDDIRKELLKLEVLREHKLRELEENTEKLAEERQRDLIRINPRNVQVLRFSVIWLPYTEFVIQEEDHRRLDLIRAF